MYNNGDFLLAFILIRLHSINFYCHLCILCLVCLCQQTMHNVKWVKSQWWWWWWWCAHHPKINLKKFIPKKQTANSKPLLLHITVNLCRCAIHFGLFFLSNLHQKNCVVFFSKKWQTNKQTNGKSKTDFNIIIVSVIWMLLQCHIVLDIIQIRFPDKIRVCFAYCESRHFQDFRSAVAYADRGRSLDFGISPLKIRVFF